MSNFILPKKILFNRKIFYILVYLGIVLGAAAFRVSALDGGNCRNNPVPPPEVSSSENFKYEWKADCKGTQSTKCQTNADCPQNKTDTSRVNPEDSNWCYQFQDGNRCLKLISKLKFPEVSEKRLKSIKKYSKNLEKFEPLEGTSSAVKKYNSFLEKTNKILEDSIERSESCIKQTDSAKISKCKDKLKNDLKKSKVSYRLTKYYSILAGRSETCVEADLGMKSHLTGTSVDKHKEERRLFFCSGLNNNVDKLNIKWRVKSKDSKKLVRVSEDYSLELDKFVNASQLKEAEKFIGVN